MLALEMEEVHKTYGSVQALAGVDLGVAKGEVLALLGPNGAGKSSLVSIASGLSRPDSGRVLVNGLTVSARSESVGASVGLAPQETGFYPGLSVEENLVFFAELAGLRGRALKARVAEIAEAFFLDALINRPGKTLSGGEARRLHTALAVLHSPDLLLLDEITTGVDVQTRNRLLELVQLLASLGTAIVYSTHYLNEVETLNASSVVMLVKGRVAASGAVAELIAAHGGATVELHFKGSPPPISFPKGTEAVGPRSLRIPAQESPAITAAQLLGSLDGASHAVAEIKLIQPSLESVFLSLTSRDLASDGASA